MSYLLLISLGPVQDFIASARQCQDLWYGSWLLSELSATIAKYLKEDAVETTLIFPADIHDIKQENGVANKILSVVDGDASVVRELAKQAENAMQEHLKNITKQAFDKVAKPFFYRDVAEAQIQDLMEYMWVAVPYSTEIGYASARQHAESLLASRKNSKNWRQPSWLTQAQSLKVPKSSLDGVRESVLHERIYPQVGVSAAVTDDQRRQQYFVKGTERLCGVGLLKRVGTDPNSAELFGGKTRPIFHSSSHMAAAKVVSRVNLFPNAVGIFIRSLQNIGLNVDRFLLIMPRNFSNTYSASHPFHADNDFHFTKCLEYTENNATRYYDGSILFEQRLLSAYKEQHGQMDSVAKKNIQKALQELRNTTDTQEPYPYYAMLLADGDKMGKALEALAPQGLATHKEVSRHLDNFTQHCRQIVENMGGSLIYAGGDDVLALLPLHTAFACADTLQQYFSSIIQKCIPVELASVYPTLSVGLAIVHHLQPMGETRRMAKRAENLAKIQRNSLGIVLKKRGGASLELFEQWSYRHNGQNLIQRIWSWANQFHKKVLPHSTAFMISEAMEPLLLNWENLSTEEQDSIAKACQSLAGGVVDRRNIQATDLLEYQNILKSYFERGEHPITQIQRLSAELQIAREMMKVLDESWMELQPVEPIE